MPARRVSDWARPILNSLDKPDWLAPFLAPKRCMPLAGPLQRNGVAPSCLRTTLFKDLSQKHHRPANLFPPHLLGACRRR